MTLTPQLAQQCLEALESAKFMLDAAIGMHLIKVPDDADGPVVQIPAAISALREALASSTTAILARAVELHEKAGMSWPEVEELALNEAGIDDKAIDELIGECASMGLESLLVTPDELRTFTRSVLVHQQYTEQRVREEREADEMLLREAMESLFSVSTVDDLAEYENLAGVSLKTIIDNAIAALRKRLGE